MDEYDDILQEVSRAESGSAATASFASSGTLKSLI